MVYECPRCDDVFETSVNLRNHFKRKNICKPNSQDKDIKIEDIIIEDCKVENDECECKYCEKTYATKYNLEKHLQICKKNTDGLVDKSSVEYWKQQSKEKDKQIKQIKEQLKEKDKQIKQLIQKPRINNNNTTINNNTIIFLSFDNTDNLLCRKFMDVENKCHLEDWANDSIEQYLMTLKNSKENDEK
jgi:hypothetical protein